MTLSTPLLVTFSAYLLLMVGIGFIAWRRTRTFDDYILGGRSLGSYVTALAAGASDMSGWLMMGLPGALYLGGASEAWIAVGLVIGAWCNWKYVAGPLRVYTERARNALTAWLATAAMRHGLFRKLAVSAAVVILAFALVLAARGGVGERLRGMALEGGSAPGLRLALAEESLRAAGAAPLTGFGAGNFGAVYAMVTRLHHPVYHVLHPESDVVWLVFECGVLMLLAVVILAGWWAFESGPWTRQGEGGRRGARADLRLRRAAGIVTGLALLHALFDVPLHRPAYFMVAAVTAALALKPERLTAATGRAGRCFFRSAGTAVLALGAVYLGLHLGVWLPPSGTTAGVLHDRAVAESAAGRHSAALADMEKAVALAPLNFRMYFLRAQLQLKLRQPAEQALMDFSRARALEPGHAGMCFDEGLYWLGFRPLFAIIPWRECLRRDPEAAQGIHGFYQRMLNSMGQHPELAEPLWQLASQVELQILYLRSAPGGEMWQARLDKVLAANPRLRMTDKAGLRMIFDAWALKGDSTKLEAGLRQHPEWQTYGWRHLAAAEAREGRFREACDLAAAHLPASARSTSLGVADIPRLERVVLLNPEDARPAVELYYAQRASGDYKAALRNLEKIATLPNPPDFLQREMAAMHMQLEDYQRAWEILRGIIGASS
ncbi:MAG TPA: hypothetical protein DIT64_09235 [Verrucomicrobiales bacterium]|nr:hypothetical protein [Verrucomicrobiales bacterium]